ncbi:MAG: serine/threonine-protein kinase [archaeon]
MVEVDFGFLDKVNRVLENIKHNGGRRYNLIGEDAIAEGGNAWVFRARDEKLGREVALKIGKYAGDSDLIDRIRKEKDFLVNHRHPNLITIYEAYEEVDGFPVIIMEMARGNLHKYIVGRDIKDLSEALEIMQPICAGVNHIHQQKRGNEKVAEESRYLVHRDLTPVNVLICGDGTVKVSDLGSTSEDGFSSSAQGTASYRAPEGFHTSKSKPFFKRQSDVYSLGLLTYFLFMKTNPFIHSKREKDKFNRDFIRNRCKEIGLEGDLVEVICRATDVNWKNRYENAGEFLKALSSLGSGLIISNGKRQDVAVRDFQVYYNEFMGSLGKPRDKIGLTVDEVVEEQYASFDKFQDHAVTYGFTNDPKYGQACQVYDGEFKRDEQAITSWLVKGRDEKAKMTQRRKDFEKYKRDGRKGKAPEMERENYDVWKILHMRQNSKGVLLSQDDSRCSMAQVRDGTFRKHYLSEGKGNELRKKK